MGFGDVRQVATGSCSDLWFVDTGMYEVIEYGSVYVLDAERPAIVETGIGTHSDRILDAIETVGLAPEDIEVIAVTHVHLDHAGGAGFLAEACPNATIVVQEIGAPHLADPERLWAGTKQAVGEQITHYVEPDPVPDARIRAVEDGDRVDLGDHSLIAHHAPGHAPHQVVYEDPANDAVFTGDAAGLYVPTRDDVLPTSPPPDFDLEQALRDVELLQELAPETLLYSHFGPAMATDQLERYARTLSDWVQAVAAARNELEDDDAVIEHFAGETAAGEVWGAEKGRGETAMNVRGVLQYLDYSTR
ncbi:hydroxyacylglutathione hydrolase protein [Halorhabdus tiamatea SARL4B]|uniref:Beta-lactamase domain protein n=1 Tax=Halorhabdus tiamatea SARL4B TaxID=1033806 RepID=F7PIU1_9EURY|nr:MBL fold metallo-hydrolase [Halorhabdus tiamatea]ERJ05432.1 hydroxyacylglutathione hydrolase protein [Halorhabdus tiamatea SARL4B]CCQ33341.1 beta-lactamase domain protein [Halorhabdus tiamatea SARL4B]